MHLSYFHLIAGDSLNLRFLNDIRKVNLEILLIFILMINSDTEALLNLD